MRLRPIVALSVAACSAVLLVGCGSAGTPEASPTGTVVDLCAAAAPSGAESEAVTIDGEPGTEATATFTAPLDLTEVQSTVVEEGAEELSPGDFVQLAYSVFDAETGDKIGSAGYQPGEFLPLQVSADTPVSQYIGCAGPGSRVIATQPATDTSAAAVFVLDVLSIVPTAAWGEPQPAVAGFPTVELAEDGEPTITVSEGDEPSETQIAVLKKGDGAVVASGDSVLVQYAGVLQSDGTVFDSSWRNGSPTQFVTTEVVPGFTKALEGQTVGSQVLAVIPPTEAYGDTEQGTIPANSTLVFVVDILGTQHPATP